MTRSWFPSSDGTNFEEYRLPLKKQKLCPVGGGRVTSLRTGADTDVRKPAVTSAAA